MFAIVSMAICLIVSIVAGAVALRKAFRDRRPYFERIGSTRGTSGLELFNDYFGPWLLDRNNEKHSTNDALGGRYVGIYIGAAWDKGAEHFDQTLVELHANINGRTPNPTFEVVYVSADRSESEFRDPFGNDWPWRGRSGENSSVAGGGASACIVS